jgi:aldehyde:ferredoxin oxidoreductase
MLERALDMRKYLHINLDNRSVETEELRGEALARVGRHFIARILLEQGAASVDPLSPENPLIFSAGPFAGTNFSNANRISVGCKSPLTGGIKEANAGGTFGFALGQLEIAGLTLYGASDDWAVIYIPKEGPLRFDTAEPYMGKGNFEAARLLFEKYGPKVGLAICGPVGEYQGLMAGIAFTDPEGRPERIAARGGGQQEDQGDRRRETQDADLPRPQEGHDRGARLRRQAGPGGRGQEHERERHRLHGRRDEPYGRAAGAQLQRRAPGRHL